METIYSLPTLLTNYKNFNDNRGSFKILEQINVPNGIQDIYKDGWHTATGTFSFYVENGKLIKGLRYGDPFGPKLIYPYKWSKRLNCYDNVSGITARYGCWKNVTWR